MYPLAKAQEIAQQVVEQLKPHCQRIEIAGSIRRQKPEVKDIEIVAIPKDYEVGLFATGIATVLDQWPRLKGTLPCKYAQRQHPSGMVIDFFTAEPINWGWIFALRTGSADFGRYKLLRALKDAGYQAEDGYIWSGNKKVWIQSEEELFNRINLPLLPPTQRNYTHPYKN